MRFCPNPQCPFFIETALIAEFSDSVDHCVDCQTTLVETFPDFQKSLQESLPDELYDEEENLLVTLATYLHQPQARLLRHRLQMAGIRSFLTQEIVVNDSFAGAVGHLQLLVREGDFEQAVTLIELEGDGF